MKTVEILRNHQEIREKYQARFRYLMVDEYQDTNRAQYVLVKNIGGTTSQFVCCRRRRPMRLCLARSGHPQHP